jgi:DNA-directed RNA polymerase alpha subunit
MTNWDKLLIDLKTDGTLSPMEAFHQASEILVNQFNALLPKISEPAPTPEEKGIIDLNTEEFEEVVAEKPAKKKSKK